MSQCLLILIIIINNSFDLFVLNWEGCKERPFKIIIFLLLGFIYQERTPVHIAHSFYFPIEIHIQETYISEPVPVDGNLGCQYNFRRKRNNWLCGTELNHDLWWQLSVGINPLQSVGLKYVLITNCWLVIPISSSRKCSFSLSLPLRPEMKSCRDSWSPFHRRRMS